MVKKIIIGRACWKKWSIGLKRYLGGGSLVGWLRMVLESCALLVCFYHSVISRVEGVLQRSRADFAFFYPGIERWTAVLNLLHKVRRDLC